MTSVAAFFADGRDNRRDGVTVWFSANRSGGISLWKRRNGRWWKSAGLSLEEVAAYMNGYAGQTKPKRLRR